MTQLRYIDDPIIIKNGEMLSERYAIPAKICDDKHCFECDDKTCAIYPRNREFILKMVNLGADALER